MKIKQNSAQSQLIAALCAKNFFDNNLYGPKSVLNLLTCFRADRHAALPSSVYIIACFAETVNGFLPDTRIYSSHPKGEKRGL